MKIKDYIRLNVVLIPDPDMQALVHTLSEKLSQQFESHFVLDSKTFFPHMTLYPAEYPVENQQALIEAAKNVAEGTKPFALPFERLGGGEGWATLHFKSCPELMQLHENVLAHANELREGHVRTKFYEQDYQVTLSNQQKQRLQTYGYHRVLEQYNAHLSLTRLLDAEKTSDAHALCKELVSTWPHFEAQSMGVYVMALHGTCVGELARFPFKV